MTEPRADAGDSERSTNGGSAGQGRITRAQACRAAALGASLVGGGALLSGSLRSGATAAPSGGRDVDILNFLLLIEFVQEGFYADAVKRGALSGELEKFAKTVGPQEREHVALLQRRLGSRAIDRPALDFGDTTASAAAFRDTALELEETGAAAYIGEGPSLSHDVVADAARIVAVEARQAAWIRNLAGENPAPRAADPPQSAADVMATLRRKGFVR